MARCLLDTGCTKFMILKKFTSKDRRTKLSDKNSIRYTTYGSSFKSSMTASVGFKMVESWSHSDKSIEYQFQVDKTSDPDKQLYDVIIGNDLLYNMGVNILFKERQIKWNDDKITIKKWVPVRTEICVKCFIACTRIVLFYKKQKSDKIR